MNPNTGRRLLVFAFLIGMGLITWDELRNGNNMPRPARYWLGGIAFAMLGVMAAADSLALVAGLFGLGLDVAIYMDLQAAGAAKKAEAINAGVAGQVPG